MRDSAKSLLYPNLCNLLFIDAPKDALFITNNDRVLGDI
jgi:hypothetical protein